MSSTVALALVIAGSISLIGQVTILEVNPTRSTLDASDPNGATGGRVNSLARANATTYYAASEWGGLYKTTDTGRKWVRLDGHVPPATWDVEVSPADANRVIATSFYDGRVRTLAGINISTNGGATWIRPATVSPPATFCTDPARREEPSAFGISFDPQTPNNVYVGTNCGLAISTDAGVTWRYLDPTPADPPDDIWDVIVHHGGIIDLCGDDGHRRSTDGGGTWTTAANAMQALPSGRCSIAASPDEPHVLFAVSGTTIFETDNGSAWTTRFVNPSPQGRIPFVATNQRTGAAFDLWFGDVSLWRAVCTTPNPATPGGSARCPASNTWNGPFTRTAGAHDDAGDIIFNPPGAALPPEQRDACPVLFSSDGGVYFNTRITSPACQTPTWNSPTRRPAACGCSRWQVRTVLAPRPKTCTSAPRTTAPSHRSTREATGRTATAATASTTRPARAGSCTRCAASPQRRQTGSSFAMQAWWAAAW